MSNFGIMTTLPTRPTTSAQGIWHSPVARARFYPFQRWGCRLVLKVSLLWRAYLFFPFAVFNGLLSDILFTNVIIMERWTLKVTMKLRLDFKSFQCLIVYCCLLKGLLWKFTLKSVECWWLILLKCILVFKSLQDMQKFIKLQILRYFKVF